MRTQAFYIKQYVDQKVDAGWKQKNEMQIRSCLKGDLKIMNRQTVASKLVHAIRKDISVEETHQIEEIQSRKHIFEYAYQMCESIKSLFDPVSSLEKAEADNYDKKVMAKFYAGKELTPEEMRYIQIHYPEMYPQVLRVQIQRKAFEEKVKHATSKAQVEEIHTFACMHIKDEDPMAEVLQAAYDDVLKEFKQTEEYEKLPDTEEDRKKKGTA